MRRAQWMTIAIGLLVITLPVAAEEIIHFKSGSAMPVVSHQIDGDMIHVDLGDNAFMAFPLSMVESVESAGKNVMLRRSNTGGTNVMKARPDPTGSFPVSGQRQSRANEKRHLSEQRQLDPAVTLDSHGVAVYHPWGNSSSPAKRASAFAGNQRVRDNMGTPGAFRGARQVGTHQVIGNNAPRRSPTESPRPHITGIDFQPLANTTPKPAPPPEGAKGSDSKSNDSGSHD